ncbi:MAG: efflux RND transporter periplasmic adaptor subunit [Betaproteobacteria bacterium]|nr:efflux RND transporter periplasmic adaptor subunit [Betaproteobacteria bacterium]MBP7780094.1 efflux RND transporter periplasmic adaptor subunit [Burkholderiaceae bacterium]
MILLMTACSKPAPPEEPVRAVKVMTVGFAGYQAETEYAAEVRPRLESRLGFRVAGKIVRRQAEIGQKVQAGQVLAEIDPKDYRLSAEAAQAQVNAAKTNRDLAQADFNRFKTLKEQNFISGAELDRREAAVLSAQAQLEQAQSQLAVQGNQAGYAKLVADRPGVVTAIEAEPGQVVVAGAPVVRLAMDGPRDVLFAVPEDKLVGVSMGTKVTVRVWSSQAILHGKVREIASSADPLTRTFAVKVALDEGTAPPLGSTVFATPKIKMIADTAVIKLPTSALRQDGNSSAVWVLDPETMTVKSRSVQVLTAEGNLAVIGGGLKPGDKVVSTGVHVLAPGQKVTEYKDKVTQRAEAGRGAP